MTHDEAFAALQARKRAEEGAAPPRYTWRRISPHTQGDWPQGGWSGLGPGRKLVYVLPVRGEFEYGRLIHGFRRPAGIIGQLAVAKRLAETAGSRGGK